MKACELLMRKFYGKKKLAIKADIQEQLKNSKNNNSMQKKSINKKSEELLIFQFETWKSDNKGRSISPIKDNCWQRSSIQFNYKLINMNCSAHWWLAIILRITIQKMQCNTFAKLRMSQWMDNFSIFWLHQLKVTAGCIVLLERRQLIFIN